jgi:hypothetical protein
MRFALGYRAVAMWPIMWRIVLPGMTSGRAPRGARADSPSVRYMNGALGDGGSVTGVPSWRIMWAPVIKHNAFIQIISVSFQH